MLKSASSLRPSLFLYNSLKRRARRRPRHLAFAQAGRRSRPRGLLVARRTSLPREAHEEPPRHAPPGDLRRRPHRPPGRRTTIRCSPSRPISTRGRGGIRSRPIGSGGSSPRSRRPGSSSRRRARSGRAWRRSTSCARGRGPRGLRPRGMRRCAGARSGSRIARSSGRWPRTGTSTGGRGAATGCCSTSCGCAQLARRRARGRPRPSALRTHPRRGARRGARLVVPLGARVGQRAGDWRAPGAC